MSNFLRWGHGLCRQRLDVKGPIKVLGANQSSLPAPNVGEHTVLLPLVPVVTVPPVCSSPRCKGLRLPFSSHPPPDPLYLLARGSVDTVLLLVSVTGPPIWLQGPKIKVLSLTLLHPSYLIFNPSGSSIKFQKHSNSLYPILSSPLYPSLSHDLLPPGLLTTLTPQLVSGCPSFALCRQSPRGSQNVLRRFFWRKNISYLEFHTYPNYWPSGRVEHTFSVINNLKRVTFHIFFLRKLLGAMLHQRGSEAIFISDR